MERALFHNLIILTARKDDYKTKFTFYQNFYFSISLFLEEDSTIFFLPISHVLNLKIKTRIVQTVTPFIFVADLHS